MRREPSVDAHAHVISPFAKIPEGPGNKPAPAAFRTQEEFYGVLAGHGITHGLIVQPSCYQHDNEVTLAAVEHGPRNALKAIAIPAADVASEDLDAMTRRGAIGMRVNLISLDPGFFERPDAKRLLRMLQERDWWLQIHVRASDFPKYEKVIRAAYDGGKIIFDHFGRPDVAAGIEEPGFARLLAFARDVRPAMKISAAYRSSKERFPWQDCDAHVAAVIEAFGIERCVWGSDWPFVNYENDVTYLQTFEWLARVVPGGADRRKVLWENPARLFGFSQASNEERTR